jgi:predicted O-methyltransferase YrrM
MIEPEYDVCGQDQCGRRYLDGLFSSLKYLKPKYCLEIGTNYGKSARVFQKYFDEYCPDGLLITCDIESYGNLDLPNVHFVKVHPHVTNSKDLHYVKDINEYSDDSINRNIEEIKKVYNGLFDFVFIDGDHQVESVKRDIMIAKTLSTTDFYILLDDIDDNRHPVGDYYRAIKENYNTYEFDNWQGVGAALMWGLE